MLTERWRKLCCFLFSGLGVDVEPYLVHAIENRHGLLVHLSVNRKNPTMESGGPRSNKMRTLGVVLVRTVMNNQFLIDLQSNFDR